MSYLPEWHETIFKKTLRYSLSFYLLIAALLTVIHIPLPEHSDINDLPERVAKLLMEPPDVITPSKTSEVPKAPEEKPKEKSTEKEKPPKPSIQQTREIVKRSGLLASLIEEQQSGSLNAVIENQRLDRALSNVDLITTPSQKNTQPLIKKNLSHETDLADKKIAHLGTLTEGDRVKLSKGEQVSLARLKGSYSGHGSSGQGDGLGSGVGIRLKGSGSGSGNGSIDYDAIARVVEQYKNGLIYLYNKELRANPTLKGTITVEFSIGANGKVVDAQVVTSTMDYTPLEKALASRIKMWKFPHLYDGIIVVTYPFVFFPV